MSYHVNTAMEIVIDEPTLSAAARLIGMVDASAAYPINEDPEAIQAYLERLREVGKQLDQHLQLTER